MEICRGFFSYLLQRTTAATELFYLLMRYSFEELGYLKVIMGTSPKNSASIHMMKRLGFSFEGLSRSEFILNGYSIDSVTYSILEYEWPTAKKALEEWLHP
jgi:RimJ/RimL family protein N-acetyltransferase